MSSVPASLSSPRTSRISLTSGGAMVLALRLLTAGAMFGLQIVLARSLGVSGYGYYAFAMAWMQALAVFGRAGLENTSLRQVAELHTREETDQLAGFLRWSRRTSLLASLLAAVTLVALTYTLIAPDDPMMRGCLLLAAAALPLLTLRQIQEARLRAVHHVWQSLIGPALWPLLLSTLVLLTVTAAGWSATAAGVIGLQIAALVICLLVTWSFVRRSPLTGMAKTSAVIPVHTWRMTAMTFLAFDAVILLRGRTSVVIAGMLIDTDTAGIYAAAERFAEVVTLGVVSINMFAAPHFAALHSQGRQRELRELIRTSQWLGLAFAVVVAVTLAAFGRPLLGLLDAGFVRGYPLLLLMLASVTFGSLAGPAAYVLAMSGGERVILNGAILCSVVNLVLSFSLAIYFGATGLAVTHLVTMIVWTAYMLWQLRVRLRATEAA